MRPIASAMIAVAMSTATGCAVGGFDYANNIPQNDGANADVGYLLLRNAFLLGGTDPLRPPPQQALFAVLINTSSRPSQLRQVTAEGGGTVRLAGPITLPPNQPVGTGSNPIGTVSGVRTSTVPMTFTFGDGTSIRAMVPVKLRAGQFASLPTAPTTPPSPTTPATAAPTTRLSPTRSPTASPTPTARD